MTAGQQAAGDAKAVRAAAARASLLAIARERFAAAGYHATSTTDLVALASVTRGALYHAPRGRQRWPVRAG